MRLIYVFAGLSLVSACKNLEEPPAPPFSVAISVESDKGVPLPQAVVERNSKEIARTDVTGKATVQFRGEEGDQLEVWVKCPEGYESPLKPTTIMLRRLSDPKKLAEYPIQCPPAERRVVVALRSEGGANLPVRYLGRDVARTDSSGAATFMLNGKPGDHMEFTLDTTSEKGNERLQPQNPTLSLVVQPKDDFYYVDQPFSKQKVQVVMVSRPRPTAIGPTQLRY